MLRRVLDEGLAPDVHVTFCNTGKEDDRTLDFVHACATRWHVPIRWLEYRRRYLPQYRSEAIAGVTKSVRDALGLAAEDAAGRTEPGFVEVTYETAARSRDALTMKHPFTNLIAMSGVPNVSTRLCTTEMKIRVMKKFMLAQGYAEWTNVVGLRADEPERVARLRVKPPERWENAMPLADAKVTVQDVLDFWANAPFDLALQNDPELGTYEGNCDLCFLKSDRKKLRVIQERPAAVEWWRTIERVSEQHFRPRMPYENLVVDATCDTDGMTDLGDCVCHE